jgi:RimJ/RimL family protein N-acetyltransferase
MARRTIETARLRLQPWDESHTELLVRLFAIPEVMRHIGQGVPLGRADAERVAAAQREHWTAYGFGWRGAADKATGELVGFVALNFTGDGTAGLDGDEYEVGWWLAPPAWGQGLAREGAQAIRDEAFQDLNAPSVVARVQPANARSIAVAEACGFAYDFTTTGKFGEAVVIYRARRSSS